MWTLTIMYGDDLNTLVHTSDRAHGWEYQRDGYWMFWSVSQDGSREGNDWDAIVSDVRYAVDVKQVEPATAQGVADVGVDPLCFDTEHDHSTSSCLGPVTAQVPPVTLGAWATGGSTRRPAYEAEGQHDPTV